MPLTTSQGEDSELRECSGSPAAGTHSADMGDVERQARLLNTALSHITDFAYVFDREGRFLYANKPLLDLWGLTLEQAVGKNFFQLQYPDALAAKLQRQIEQVRDTGLGLSDETEYTGHDGSPGYYEYIFSPVFAPNGTVEMVAGSTRDITIRKRAEDARHESERQLQEVFDTAPAFMAVLRGPHMIFEQANRAYLQLIGKRSEVIGKPLLEVLPEIVNQPFANILQSVLTTGEVYHGNDVRILLQRAEGAPLEEVWVDFVYQALRDPNGNITGVLAHGVDLTERKRAEKDLRESEVRLRALVSASSDALFRTSPDWSQIWQLQGLNLTHATETSPSWLEEFIHPEDRARFMETVEEAIRTKSVFEIEHRVLRPGGAVGWNVARAVPLLSDDNEIVEWFGAASDITEKKLASIELLTVRDQAVEANRVKSAFLANISHELRTPLNAIIGYAEMVTEELEKASQPELTADVKSIQASGKHLLSLINDILDLSKIEAGKMELQIEEVAIDSLLREITQVVQPLSQKNRNQLSISCISNCGTLQTDSTKLRQILLNLLSNALKFTEDGTVSLTVEREQGALGNSILFQVADTGIGMSKEQLSRLFREFTQLDDSSTRKHGGTGLGLAISRRFSHLIGGDITVVSEVGKGSTFTLRLASP